MQRKGFIIGFAALLALVVRRDIPADKHKQKSVLTAGGIGLRQQQAGFTLLEVMLALGAGSLMLLAISRAYPAFQQQSMAQLRQYQLEQSMWLIVRQISRDLWRTGFCAGKCDEKTLKLDASAGEAAQSCVILGYDFNHDGVIDSITSSEPESIGYRLREGQLQAQRGVRNCAEAGWENLLDQQEIEISRFQLQELGETASIRSPKRVAIQLTANWRRWPQLSYQIATWIRVENQ